ncbi:MAG: M56 family metallopeptidase [Rikenellaceae bacterium]
MEFGLLAVYLIKATIYMLALYMFNKLVLSKNTFHRMNRFMWLGVLVCSFLLPLLKVESQAIHQAVISSDLNALINTSEKLHSDTVSSSSSNTTNFTQFACYTYLFGVLAFTIYYLITYSSLIKFLRSISRLSNDTSAYESTFRECETLSNTTRKIRYIVHNQDIAPFSWFNYIVLSEKNLEEAGKDIILHELAHSRQRHSLDITTVNIASILLWFNPTVWLIKRELQQVHEYLADEDVLTHGTSMRDYQLLLIKESSSSYMYSLSNNFFQSSLKKRMLMMLKEKSNKWSAAKSLIVVPTVALASLLIASPFIANNLRGISTVTLWDEAPLVTEDKDTEGIELVLQKML